MKELHKKKCIPCAAGASPLKGKELEPFYMQLGEGWNIVDEHHLSKVFTFKTFDQALAFAVVIGKIANEENHHPDLRVSWGKLGVEIWTHKINGLSESDFVLAAKIEAEWVSREG
ncbi:MAG: 4a-hydroxytetrahydrobiopterin dehydratase [Chlamydiota bacterium]